MRTGIDIIEIKRISLDEKFVSKIAKESEIEYIKTYKTEHGQNESLAGLWAVKEAVFKMLGLGKDSGVSFKDVELCHDETSRPFVKLFGVALDAFNRLGLKQIDVSISHTETTAVAIAVAI